MKRAFAIAFLTIGIIVTLFADSNRGIIAVGDVHGAYESFVVILQQSQVIDKNKKWIAENTILVQTGDLLDRGPDSRKAMDLLMTLENRHHETIIFLQFLFMIFIKA
jgi:hypothetical protein